jgi:hypothetical protein
MSTYNFAALPVPTPITELGYANGVNNSGLVVGRFRVTATSLDTPCNWQAGHPIGLPLVAAWPEEAQVLAKVADSGDAVGAYPYVMNGPNAVSNVLAALGGAPGDQMYGQDINNAHTMVGVTSAANGTGAKNFIFNYITDAITLLDQTDIPLGINNLGDVVGVAGSEGFLRTTGGNVIRYPNCWLNDINDSLIAAGFTPGASTTAGENYMGYPDQAKPIWVDCRLNVLNNHSAPIIHAIPLPSPYEYGVAVAVNNNGLVLGNCWNLNTSAIGAFVYNASAAAAVAEIVTINNNVQQWYIGNVEDINDHGQIVGQAVSVFEPPRGYTGRETAFLLTPVPDIGPWDVLPGLPGEVLRKFLARPRRPLGKRKE